MPLNSLLKCNLTAVIDTMLKEKEKSELEIKVLKEELISIDEKEYNFLESLKGNKFQEFARLVLNNLDAVHPFGAKKTNSSISPKNSNSFR